MQIWKTSRLWSETLIVILTLIVVAGSNTVKTDLPPVNLASLNPTSREELLEYASMLSKKCSTFEESSAYPFFVEMVVRDLVTSLSLEDTRKVSACINVPKDLTPGHD